MTGLVRLTHSARCISPGCTWTHEGPDSDKAAEKHTKTAVHPSVVSTTPAIPREALK